LGESRYARDCIVSDLLHISCLGDCIVSDHPLRVPACSVWRRVFPGAGVAGLAMLAILASLSVHALRLGAAHPGASAIRVCSWPGCASESQTPFRSPVHQPGVSIANLSKVCIHAAVLSNRLGTAPRPQQPIPASDAPQTPSWHPHHG
jgi:hypothetical protein